jgi:outer membrane protein
MTGLIVPVVLLLALSGVPSFAQAPAAPAAQAAAPAPAPRPPFPEGAKIAYLNLQRVANESAEGKASTGRIQALNEQKLKELGEKNKALQALQQKLQQTASVMNDAARTQLEKDIERQQVEIQRFTQDAQAETQDLQQDLQSEFQRKLVPIIQEVAVGKGLHFVFSQIDSGLVWAEPGLDITDDVIQKFDQASAKGQTK